MREPVTVIFAEDEFGEWAGLYVDDGLFCEGHSIYKRDWIELINTYKFFSRVDTYRVNSEWLEERGNLPCEFDEIPSEMLTVSS